MVCSGSDLRQGGRAHGPSGSDRQSTRRGMYHIKIKCKKVGLTDEKETELGEMPRRIATKVKTGQFTNKGSQGNTYVRLIYLVKVEEKVYWRNYIVMWKNHKEKCL